ncbi:hypothetical protein Tco_0232002, partial [Tanacetum coccineum]
IMDIKAVLTQKALKTFSETFHILDEVHPQLPSPNQTIHEMPTRKIGVYTRLFKYANFQLPLSTFLVDVLRNGFALLILTHNPTKVRVGERKHDEDEPKLLDATIGLVVPLLLIAPARGESELEYSMDKLFCEGASGDQVEQGDSASGGQGVGIQFVSKASKVVVEGVAPLQPRCPKKQKTTTVDAGEPSHPAKAVQNVEVRGEIVPTLPFVTSSVSATPEREDETHTNSVARTNLQTLGPPLRFIISSNSSHHSDANVAEAEVDSIVRSSAPVLMTATIMTTTVDATMVLKETSIKPSLFAVGSSSAGGNEPILGGFYDLTGNDFLWNVTNRSRLDDGGVRCEMFDEFAPLKFFVSIRGMEHDQIFTEFNVGAAHQMSLSAEVRMRTEYNFKEKRRLKSIVDEQTEVLKAREKEIEDLRAQLLLKEAEAAKAIRLHAKVSQYLAASVKVREQEVADLDAQVHELETSSAGLYEKVTVYEDCMSQLENFQDGRMRVVNDKFNKLYTDFVEMALHLEEKFYPHLLMAIVGRRWPLTYDIKLTIVKCLHSPEYLSPLRVAISKAIKKGMQDKLAAGITHGQEGRVLTDVAAFNPSMESDYVSALQEFQDVNFSLLAELKSNKDVSVKTLMDILRLEETLADILGLNEVQPHINQLMVPIHHSSNQTIVSATGLSFSLDVSHNRVQKIRDDIANHRSALYDMFVPLVEPLSSAALEGTEGTSGAALDTTTTLSTTYASASSIPTILTDDYVVVHADSQEGVGADVNPLPNVDDAELNIS